MSLVSKLLAGMVCGIVTGLLAWPLGAAMGDERSAAVALLAALLIVFAICMAARTALAAWVRGALLAGLAFVAVPYVISALATGTASPGWRQ